MNSNADHALRQKLAELDAREVDPTVEPEALWNAIQRELAPKKSARIRLPRLAYWAAAASFIAGGLLTALWLTRTGESPVGTAIHVPVVSKGIPDRRPRQSLDPLPQLPATERVTQVAGPKPAAHVADSGTIRIAFNEKAVAPPAAHPEPIPETPQPPDHPIAAQPPVESSSLPGRALYLLDVAPQEKVAVTQSAASQPTKNLPFLISPNRLPVQTAFQRPGSVFQGLRN